MDRKLQWEIKNSVDASKSELVLYGEVCSTTPTDWWTGEKLSGDFIALDEFKEDIKQLSGKDEVTVRINSGGGNYYDGLAIYNMLKSLNTKLTVYIEGIAASAASIIAMAGDTVKMYPGSVMMIHPALAQLRSGLYNKDDLNEIITRLDVVSNSAVATYQQKNKIKSKEEIVELLNETTWMVGQEAVDLGFADEVIEDKNETPSIEMKLIDNNKTLVVNGVKFNAEDFGELPKTLNIQKPSQIENALNMFKNCFANKKDVTSDTTETSLRANVEKGKDNEMEIKNIEDLQKAYPALVEEIQNKAVESKKEEIINSERERIEAIEKIENAIADKALVNKAKFDKKESMTASELALLNLQTQAKAGATYMDNLMKDNQNSGVNELKTAPVEMNEDKVNAGIKALADAIK